jgi:aryl-alcohol dehydrogenase-like predicted oxidoreductase
VDYRNLWRSGLKVSPLCLGTMMFGGATDEPTAPRIIAKVRDAGVNFIDSADAYNGCRSEVRYSTYICPVMIRLPPLSTYCSPTKK